MANEGSAPEPRADGLSMRQATTDLLAAWTAGSREPSQVFGEARSLWLSRRWPQQHEKGFDLAATDVLFMLASARDAGLTDDDIPILVDYLRAKGPRDINRARDRLYAHLEATIEHREAMASRDDYYGPLPIDGVEDTEFAISDPAGRRLHEAIRLDPEQGWAELRARLCQGDPRDELLLFDLVEDLMFSHASEFIDRIERLADDCPQSRVTIAHAHVGGLAATPALERFWDLQRRLGGDQDG